MQTSFYKAITTHIQTWGNAPLPKIPVTLINVLTLKRVSIVMGIYLILVNIAIYAELETQFKLASFIILILGIALLALGLWIQNFQTVPLKIETLLFKIGEFFGIWPVQVLCLLVSPLTGVTAGFLGSQSSQSLIHPAIAVTSWVISIMLIVLSGWIIPNQETRPRRSLIIWVLFLCLLGSLTRVFYLSNIPVSWTGDEGSSGLTAIEFLTGSTNNIFSALWHGFPSLFFFVQSIPIAILGRTFEALRLSSAIAGILTVGASYLLGRALFNHRVGLITGILLAGQHFHIHFSRIGLNNVWDGLTMVVTLGSLWYAWKHENRNAFLLTGLSLGLSQYFYPSARILFVIIPAWLLFTVIFERKKFWRLFPDLVLMALTSLVIILPIASFYVRHQDEFFGPMRGQYILPSLIKSGLEQGVPAWLTTISQIWLGLRGFVSAPLVFWYRPEVPILRIIPAILAIIGLAGLLLRPKDMRLYLILLWVFGIGLIGGLSESTPAAQRYVAGAPVAVLLVACGLELTGKTIVKFLPAFQRAVIIVVILASVLLAADDIRFYFMEYTPQSYYHGRYDFEGQGGVVTRYLASYLQTQSPAWQVVFVGYPILGFQTLPSMQFIAPHIQGIDLIKPWGDPQNPAFPDKMLIFVFTADHDSDLAAVKEAYPGGKLFTETSELGQNVYAIYQVPPPSITPEHIGPFYVFQTNLSIAWMLIILFSLMGAWLVIFWLNQNAPLAVEAQIAPRHEIFSLSPGKFLSQFHSEKENPPAPEALKAGQIQIPNAETHYQENPIETESASTVKTINVQISADIPVDTIVRINFQALDGNDKAIT